MEVLSTLPGKRAIDAARLAISRATARRLKSMVKLPLLLRPPRSRLQLPPPLSPRHLGSEHDIAKSNFVAAILQFIKHI
jgi:hypothetical protein